MAQKKIVITVSRQFPKTKRRSGEPTQFREKLAKGEKIHTIRRNYDFGGSILKKWRGVDITSQSVSGWASHTEPSRRKSDKSMTLLGCSASPCIGVQTGRN